MPCIAHKDRLYWKNLQVTDLKTKKTKNKKQFKKIKYKTTCNARNRRVPVAFVVSFEGVESIEKLIHSILCILDKSWHMQF